jgi:phosphopantothenoylcysteine decarboxylase/phosphopantothenate--cysteine ligase
MALEQKRILLVIGGGIAAYKSLMLIRGLRERGANVRVVMTKAAQEFVTPLAAGALAGERAYTDMFDAMTEFDVGHIRIARDTDFVVVAPATADLMAKIAGGHADDLASTVLLATDKRILLAPAMNPHMWVHPATQRNLAQLLADGVSIVGPNEGEMAERGEAGIGRMAEPEQIISAVEGALVAMPTVRSLAGKRVLVTSGPTQEPIDPVRFLTNRSSGKQGHALARAAAQAGAEVVLISGPVELPDPAGVKTVHVTTATEMLQAAEAALPVDVAICAAAVADWRVAEPAPEKLKKVNGGRARLELVENPDVLAAIAHHRKRPRLVVGFAAETEKLIDHARAKLQAKGCDWIVANDVSPGTGVLGGARNTVHLVTHEGVESWPPQSKQAVADGLIRKIVDALAGKETRK